VIKENIENAHAFLKVSTSENKKKFTITENAINPAVIFSIL